MLNILCLTVTCDVTGDLEVKFLNFVWKVPPGLSIAVWIFPRLLVSEIDRGPLRPPPPPPAEGRGRTRPSRARVNHEKDLGIIVDQELKFHQQTAAAVAKASQVLAVVKRSFAYIDNFTATDLQESGEAHLE